MLLKGISTTNGNLNRPLTFACDVGIGLHQTKIIVDVHHPRCGRQIIFIKILAQHLRKCRHFHRMAIVQAHHRLKCCGDVSVRGVIGVQIIAKALSDVFLVIE